MNYRKGIAGSNTCNQTTCSPTAGQEGGFMLIIETVGYGIPGECHRTGICHTHWDHCQFRDQVMERKRIQVRRNFMKGS